MNRRRFLTYAAAGVVVMGSALAGYEFDRWQTPLAPSCTSMVTVTETFRETTTETERWASLYGRLFFDYNGNGVRDGEEPAVSGALVQLSDGAANVVAEGLTDSSGDYELEDVRTGSYRLRVKPDKKFRYMCRSGEEFTSVSEGYDIPVNGIQRLDIGLMEGFLTKPFLTKKYSIGRFYDWDTSPSTYLWWNARRGSEREHGGSENHEGIDYDMAEGENVVAPAPGLCTARPVGPQGQLSLVLYHPSGDLYTFYNHLSKRIVNANETVVRGQKIAESGSTGTPYPHLHLNTSRVMPAGYEAVLDCYHPVFALDDRTSGYWVHHGDDVYWQKVDPVAHPNSLSGTFWTKNNDPQYSVTA